MTKQNVSHSEETNRLMADAGDNITKGEELMKRLVGAIEEDARPGPQRLCAPHRYGQARHRGRRCDGLDATPFVSSAANGAAASSNFPTPRI